VSTATIERGQTLTTGDPHDAAHIVQTPPTAPDQTPQAYVLRARFEGFPIEALCGFTWIPHKNPERLPICEGCREVYHQPGKNREDRERMPDA